VFYRDDEVGKGCPIWGSGISPVSCKSHTLDPAVIPAPGGKWGGGCKPSNLAASPVTRSNGSFRDFQWHVYMHVGLSQCVRTEDAVN